jgi:hypothetical protein
VSMVAARLMNEADGLARQLRRTIKHRELPRHRPEQMPRGRIAQPQAVTPGRSHTDRRVSMVVDSRRIVCISGRNNKDDVAPYRRTP